MHATKNCELNCSFVNLLTFVIGFFFRHHVKKDDSKCDFWHARYLFYLKELILIDSWKFKKFLPHKFPWNVVKMVKILQLMKTPCKKLHMLTWPGSKNTFFDWPLISLSSSVRPSIWQFRKSCVFYSFWFIRWVLASL